ncbi:eukaryotic translation initiation factor 4G-like protein isoform X1 [Tanacetum coccineum]
MSVNQSKSDRTNNDFKRSGRPNNPNSPRNFSGGGGRGGGGGGPAAAPSSGYYSGKSYKKVVSNNASSQGVQTSRVAGSAVNPNANVNVNTGGGRGSGAVAPNGAHVQPPLRVTGATVKPTDTSVPKSTPGLPKAPPSNAAPPSSGTGNATGPATPVKGSGASVAFPFQFGSISPGVINGIQVPARTSSAPPNMDEQKRAQARLDSLKPTSYPNPPVPKQQLPRKDTGPVDQPNTVEVRPTSKEKNDMLSTPPPVTAHTQKPAGPPMPSIPMPITYHQSPLQIPFGAQNSPLQSQGMPNPALPVPHPMHLSVGNPPQPVFVQGIPHHQGIIHPSPGLTFPPQMGPQIGSMGMGMGFGPQFQQQQQQQPMGNFSAGRITVKITHPDTHEELRLDKRNDGFGNDGSAGPRSHPHGPPQARQMNYYSNSFNTNPHFLPTQTAPGSQAPRLYNQASKQVTVKPAVSTHVEKVGDSSPTVVKSEILKSQRTGGEGTSTHPHKDLETVNSEVEVAKKVTVNKEEQKQPAKNAESIPTDKGDGQASSVFTSSVPAHEFIDSGLQETPKSSTLSMESNKGVLETSNKVVLSSVADASASKCDNKEGLSSTEAISSGTNLDNTPKDEGPVVEIVGSEEQVKESVVQNQDCTVTDVTVGQQKENVNYVDDKSSGSVSNADLDVLSAQTSSLNLDDGLSKNDGKDVDQVNSIDPVILVEESHTVSVTVPETAPLTSEADATSGKVKGNTGKGKKKIRDILKKADARGTTSDLYNAYKRPEEKKDTLSAEIVESNTSVKSSEKAVMSNERCGPSKVEPEDWEDAADISAPKLGTGLNREDDNDGMTKKYSRDFLLKFLDQCTDLPEGFEITSDIAEALIASSINMAPHPSPGRGGVGGGKSARLDRHNNLSFDDKRNKGSVPIMGGQGWDPRLAMGYPGRGNHGVLQTPWGQPPNQYTGGIYPGQMPSPGPQGHPMQRNNSGSDRWQRASNYQLGLMPSPHTPVMHKAERKYQVGNITDEEQAKQRQLKGILNKLTPQNFEKLFEQVKQVNIDNANTLSGVIGQIFDKALMEPTFVEMYANFCSRLAVELPDFSENDEKITFKRLLLNKCQEEFERGEREEEEANRTEEEGEVKQTEAEREEKRIKARRRMLGNIRLIGELYKKKMLTERIMHECIKKLLGQYENPDEEDIEALCKLMSTIGEMIDHSKAKEHMDVYFSMMFKLSNNMTLSSRVRFMLKDSIDLRKNKWQQRRKVEGPKKIDEVHRDAAQERQAQSSRLARAPTSNPPLRRGQPMDFGSKGSSVSHFNPQMSGYRGVPQQQARSFGNQDPRAEERHFENRTLVPSRPMGDENLTFVPQGGLARGMLGRGQPPTQGMPLHGGPNGYGSIPQRAASYGYVPERNSPRAAYDPSSIQHQNMNTRNTGRVFDRLGPFSPPERASMSTPPQSGSSDEVLSEDHLHDKSVETIKEFYCARDEKEVALCIKDLNAPGFYPTMISIWVTDSFERKDRDRDSLAKLLINLTRSQDGILSQDSLVRGFESVLSSLEDAINDAPKAGEYLGQLFARVLLENVIPYKEVWRLIYEGGEEPGGLVKTGHAAEVLGVILDIIKSEKGDPFLKDLYAGSNLRLENFRSPTNKKTSRLDKFF